MVRECIIGEAMHALGIPTTRSLAVTTTGEPCRTFCGTCVWEAGRQLPRPILCATN